MRFGGSAQIIATLLVVACGGGSGTPSSTPPKFASATVAAGTRTPSVVATVFASATPTTPVTSTPRAATPSPTPAGQTGIAGTVTIGPTCPVQRIDSPCPDRPYEATITIWQGSMRIAETRSGADGRFLIELGPGTYRLVGESGGTLPRAVEQMVTVEAGRLTEVAVQYDSGIR